RRHVLRISESEDAQIIPIFLLFYERKKCEMRVRNRMSAGVKAVAGTLALAMTVAACGGGESASGGPAGEIDRDATLRMAWTVTPNNLDPHQSSNYAVEFNYLSPVYDRLTNVVAGPDVDPM